MYPGIFRRGIDSHHINPHFFISLGQESLNHHTGIQWDPVGLPFMILFHELIDRNQYRPWMPGLPFATFDGIQPRPAAVWKLADDFFLTPAPCYLDDIAIA